MRFAYTMQLIASAFYIIWAFLNTPVPAFVDAAVITLSQ